MRRVAAGVAGVLAAIGIVVGVIFGTGNQEPGVQQTPSYPTYKGEIFYQCFYAGTVMQSGELMDSWHGCKAPQDGSYYYTPVLYRNGVAVKPRIQHTYYRNTILKRVTAFPQGFVASQGDPNATSAQPQWTKREFWQCGDTSASTHFATPPNCPNAMNGQGETALTLIVKFGQCWGGGVLKWPVKLADGTKGCPSGTIVVPQFQQHVQYMVADAANAKMTWSTGSIFGTSSRFVNGWAPPDLQAWLDKCINGGLSCHVRSDGTLG